MAGGHGEPNDKPERYRGENATPDGPARDWRHIRKQPRVREPFDPFEIAKKYLDERDKRGD